MDPNPATQRLHITITINEPDPNVIQVWATLQASDLIDQLWDAGINADITNIRATTQPIKPTHAPETSPPKPGHVLAVLAHPGQHLPESS
jgi:hypothetical protein